MKERLDSVGPLETSGTRKFCADIEVLRKEELKRRRLLRLEQVRQQSKDIASDIRNKVRLEKNSLTENFEKRTEVAVSQWKEQKLAALQNELTQTLSYVGSAHKQAECKSKQEEVKQQLKNHHVEAADRRARQAILRIRSDELARKQAEEARRLQQQRVRFVEEARTAVLVSLPQPKSTVPVGVVPQVPKPKVVRRERAAESCKKQWPPKPWPVSIPLGVTPANIDDIDSNKTNDGARSVVTKESKDDGSDQRPHQLNHPVPDRPGGHAQSKTTSSKLSSCESSRNATASRSSEVSKEVELYDYSNGSHVQYVKPKAVSTSIPTCPVDGVEAAEACVSISSKKLEASQTYSSKRIERGKEAIRQVKARREHQALLSELASLVRQQVTLRSFIPDPKEPKKIQKKLNEAVLDLLKDDSGLNVEKGSLDFASTEPATAQDASLSVDTSGEANDTIIDVCSQDESIVQQNWKKSLEEAHRRGPETAASGVTIREEEQNVKGEKTSLERKKTDDSLAANETSLGSDVPVLNLALWTSRSPGGSDQVDETLTPSEKQRGSSHSSPSEEDQGKSSTRRSRPAKKLKPNICPARKPSPVPSRTQAVPSAGRIRPVERNPVQKEESPPAELTARISPVAGEYGEYPSRKEIHQGSGDYVPKQENPEEETPSRVPEDRRRSKKVSPSSSSSTSYMSLPNKLLSAITDDLRSLLSLTRRRRAANANPLLAHYINRLLEMSHQSVERLNVATSELPTPPSAIFRNASTASSNETEQLVVSADASSSSDSSDLVTVMRQCHARISSLTQVIEQVRRESGVASPMQRKSPSFHLDSTVYLSPPPSVMPAPQALPRNIGLAERSNPIDESYGGVITRLISEIRQQLAKEAEEPLPVALSPPPEDARSSSELCAIPEQDSSSLEWSSVVISSETGGSSDVEKEFSRMGLGWAGTTLRKTKQAGTLDSNSSLDLLELSASALSMFGNYSHSTPIKAVEEKLSRT